MFRKFKAAINGASEAYHEEGQQMLKERKAKYQDEIELSEYFAKLAKQVLCESGKCRRYEELRALSIDHANAAKRMATKDNTKRKRRENMVSYCERLAKEEKSRYIVI